MAVVIDEPTDVLTGAAVTPDERVRPVTFDAPSASDSGVELGIWLSGLESFLAGPPTTGEPLTQLRLVGSVVERCIRLTLRFRLGHSDVDLNELDRVLREARHLSKGLEHGGSISSAEFAAWCSVLSDRLRSVSAVKDLIASAEANGEQYLPEPLKGFAAAAPKTDEDAELALVLPRFAKILRWLSVVGRMLENDDPLKPALLIFARVNEQIVELVGSINNRLARSSNEETELFSSLDAASYTAGIAHRKVFSAEFHALHSVRPAPSIYASVETAYAMLNESCQQILAGLARLIDPSAADSALFPASKVNFERSLVLRQEIYSLIELTRAAEGSPEAAQLASLSQALTQFMDSTSRFLFYKDMETFDRFVEEILVTKQTKDLVPTLHRFGAYLETLFGHINLRSALKDHPFETK